MDGLINGTAMSDITILKPNVKIKDVALDRFAAGSEIFEVGGSVYTVEVNSAGVKTLDKK